VNEFIGQDLRGARFDDCHLAGARFHNVSLAGARITGSYLGDVAITGEIDGLTVNGVDVTAFVHAELDRLHPDRPKMRPTDADGFREAWSILERLWGETVARAKALPPEALHERVEGEWSFVETLRHLVFATDSWVRRAILGDPSPWHPLDLPHDDMEASRVPPVPRDREARPSLDEVLALRADRQATVRSFLTDLTDDALAGTTTPVDAPGYPESRAFPIRDILLSILNEEWQHRLYAERDLAVLASR
jgi:uncharacterized damage-inducible protein DinB